jgi:ribose transport system ATP-binding protein
MAEHGGGPLGGGGHDDRATAGVAALVLSHLSKTFPGTKALDDVSFTVGRGEFHALLGGNGSGKSTLIKILAGIYRADPGGTITVDGRKIPGERTSPEVARDAGLLFLHQNPAVFPALSVAENLAIGRGFERTPMGGVSWRRLRRRAASLLDRYDIPARPDTLVRDLGPAERAMVAIARTLQDQEGEHSGLLVLDEPTASLPRAEVNRLLGALKRYAAGGQTILFVSHRLDEVVGIADRATVLRDGVLAGTVGREEITQDRLIELIAGRPLDRVFPSMPEVSGDQVVLDVRHLAGGPLVDVSFQLRRGEVLGIAGLLGSGRSELLKMLFGAYGIRAGQVLLDGRPVRFRHVGDAVRAGLAYVPEDRGKAAFFDMSISDNLAAAMVSGYWHGGRLHHRAADADARRTIDKFSIGVSSERQEMATVSGGNQQKVILARWLMGRPRLLLLDEPTQGVDVNARAEIYGLVLQAVTEGCSVLVVTNDFEELSRVSDRVIVLNDGRVTATLLSPNITPIRLTELVYATSESVS